MVTQKRTLLIVEDDEQLNNKYKLFCKMALRELSTEGLSIESIDDAVKQAFNYAEARAILEEYAVDFISVDLALGKKEERKTELARKDMGEPGGIVLLEELQKDKKRPISVVVSGETLQSYAIDAYRKYGVLAFYQKATLNIEEYKNAIKAALLYLDVIRLITNPETELDIETAEKMWQRTLEVADRAGIESRNFLETIEDKIKSIRSQRTYLVTKLPNGLWTEEKLKGSILGREDGVLIQVMIKGFDDFVVNYGSQEEAILVFIAELLKDMRAEFQDQELFIGHFGYREYTSEPSFIIIPGEKSFRRATEIANWIESEFRKRGGVDIFTSIEKGQSATFAIEAKVLTGKENNFLYLDQLLDTLRLPEHKGDIEKSIK